MRGQVQLVKNLSLYLCSELCSTCRRQVGKAFPESLEVHDDVGMMHISVYHCFSPDGRGLHMMTGALVTKILWRALKMYA